MNGQGLRPAVIGFDTSNYRTSAAVVTLDGEILADWRELLPVSEGERGLRQSEAVFAHIRQLRNSETLIRSRTEGIRIVAVAASTKPRDGEDSYMPVFQVGHTVGSILAAAMNVPFFETTHQRGHLAAAVLVHFGANLLSVILQYANVSYPALWVYIVVMVAAIIVSVAIYRFLIKKREDN